MISETYETVDDLDLRIIWAEDPDYDHTAHDVADDSDGAGPYYTAVLGRPNPNWPGAHIAIEPHAAFRGVPYGPADLDAERVILGELIARWREAAMIQS